MLKPPHIVIIGAGIIGLSTAYALLERRAGLKVTLLEAGPKAGYGASWANGSMIHPSQAWPWQESGSEERGQDIAIQSYELARRSSHILRAHFDKFDLALRHRKSGTVKLYNTQSRLEAGLERLNILAAHGLIYELWSPQELTQHLGLPATPQQLHAAVHFPDDHSGPARLYCAALINAITALGGKFKTGAQAMHIEGSKIILVDGPQINADQVIICAGAGSAALMPELEVVAVRGYSRTFSARGLGAHIPPIPIMDDQAHISLTPLGDHFRISGGADTGPQNPDIYAYFSDYVDQRFAYLRPLLKGAIISDWTAQRPMRKGGPFMGQVFENVWANIGHGHMGWTLCAGAGAHMADEILG